jgi:prepilin-type N-terminal cleavage/methylation domain-containing protein
MKAFLTIKQKTPDPRRSALTLVELLTVIAIIAILMGLILGVAGYATRKADRSRAIADMEKIKNALEEYRLAYGSYPTNTEADNSSNWVSALWYQPLHETPKRRPFLVMRRWTNESEIYSALDPWGNSYRYFHVNVTNNLNPVYATNNNSLLGYDLWSEGLDLSTPSDNIDNWSGSPR